MPKKIVLNIFLILLQFKNRKEDYIFMIRRIILSKK